MGVKSLTCASREGKIVISRSDLPLSSAITCLKPQIIHLSLHLRSSSANHEDEKTLIERSSVDTVYAFEVVGVHAMTTTSAENEKFDYSKEYDGKPTSFTIELHHGGRFTKVPETTYVDGKVEYLHHVDIDEFCMHDLDGIMLELGYSVPPVIYYHFKIPNGDLDFGLRALGNDQDILILSQFIPSNKLIQVYTEHGRTNLLTYFMSPQGKRKVIIEEIDEDVVDLTKINSQPTDVDQTLRDKDPLVDAIDKEGVHPELGEYMSLMLYGNLAEQVTPEYRSSRIRTSSKGGTSCSKKLFLEYSTEERQQEHVGAPSKAFEVDDQQQERQEEHDDQPQEREGDTMSGFVNEETFNDFGDVTVNLEDEMDVENSEDEVDVENSEDEEDSDFMVDAENNVHDVDVDMADFRLNIDSDVEFMGGEDVEATDNEDEHEEIEVINTDHWDSLEYGSDEDRKRRAILKELGKERRCSLGEVHSVGFHVGKKFKTKKDLKDKIDLLALETRRNLYFEKNDNIRLKARCRGAVAVIDGGKVSSSATTSKGKGKDVISEKIKCTWFLHASRSNPDSDWFVKTLNPNHTCQTTRKIRACTATFISKQIIDQVEANPVVPLRALKDQFEKKFHVGLSTDKVFRAKTKATNLIVGDYTKQYEVLRDYVLELQATNVNTTVKIDIHSEANPGSPTRQFKRIYVCLGPLKEGFKAGMRELLGLDGTFMKGPFPGQVLTAVGLDSNNGIYPLAYAVVESENTDSWKWFLSNLGDDLELTTNSNFTFISDRQKGILPAIATLFPCAEHRFCIRHIYDNMRKQWKAVEYKEFLWKCATATTMPEFEQCMTEFTQYDKEACDWLKQIPPQHWARSHFSGRAVSDVMINNLCEVFNGKIEHGRDKPIIGCLEYIREYLMKRVCNVMKEMKKAKGPLTPTATTILKGHQTQASQYYARWNGGHKYQVSGAWQDQHVVDVKNNTCTCRKWELIGIPCKHAIATLNEMAKNSEDELDIYKWVHKVYWLDTWEKAYSFKVEPIKGRTMWPKSMCPTKLVPPPHHKQVGRPKRKRQQSQGERLSNSQRASQSTTPEKGSNVGADGVERLTRRFLTVTCTKCKNKGHNSRTCKGQGGSQAQGGSQSASQGQTGSQRGSKAGRARGSQAGRARGSQAGRPRTSQAGSQLGGQAGSQRGGQTGRPRGSQRGGQTGRPRGSQRGGQARSQGHRGKQSMK